MGKDPERGARERATGRAERTLQEWRDRGRHAGPYAHRGQRGEVVLERVEARQADGLTYLEVWVGGATEGGDPHFRVVNPPTLVLDPEGSVEVHGKRWREDPLAALAEVIGMHGGALAVRRRSR